MADAAPDCGHRELLVRADSLCSLILHRETRGISPQSRRELHQLVEDLRKETEHRG